MSAELFSIPLGDGRYLVYAPLRRAALVGNAALVNALDSLRQDGGAATVPPDLIELLGRLEIVGGDDEERPLTHYHGQPEPTAVTLFLTTTCNLRCTYCYAAAGDTPRKFMSLDIARRGIDFVSANALRQGNESFDVGYHGGGEPTAHWTVLTESFEYAQRRAAELNLSVRATCATNGFLNDRQIDWVIENLASVSLSFDGLPEVQDKHRLTVSGQGSSERVLHTIRRFDAAGFSYGIRVTVTHDQIARLPESVAFICRHSLAREIQVEPAYQMGRWTSAPSAETAEFIEAYREAYRIARSLGRRVSYSAARLDTLTNHFCGITQDSFSLSTDGNVSACFECFSEDSPHAGTFFYGRPDDSRSGYHFELPVLNRLRGLTVENRPFCEGCFAKWHCAGDCHHKALTVSGDSAFAGSERCHITRELTKDALLDRIESAGGLFWHEPAPCGGTGSNGKEFLL